MNGMPDREKVISWLTEISLRPCDFIRDDFDEYETEHLANDALDLLKELEKDRLEIAHEMVSNSILMYQGKEIIRCKDCKAWKQYDDMNLGECELFPEYNKCGEWYCNFGERKEGR